MKTNLDDAKLWRAIAAALLLKMPKGQAKIPALSFKQIDGCCVLIDDTDPKALLVKLTRERK